MLHPRSPLGRIAGLLALLTFFFTGLAQAATLGLDQLPATPTDGPVTLFYPAESPPQRVQHGPFAFDAAPGAAPVRGNGRLVVVSHGSGGAPWVHVDQARSLVAAGFVVAMPEHRADNARDGSDPGPDSWTQRPAEVSRAIDTVGRDPRFAPLLRLDRVGLYGISAGGHTALSLAGGRWSPAAFARHCDTHLDEDFQFCVGLITRLTGGPLDGLKRWGARTVIRHRFAADTRMREDHDPRIAAAVAGVPGAADFDLDSLVTPRIPLALIGAQQDRWLIPRFHGDAVLAACRPRCELLADLALGSHGSLLSPQPPALDGLIGDLLNDPPGFDRAAVRAAETGTTAFFSRHLLP